MHLDRYKNDRIPAIIKNLVDTLTHRLTRDDIETTINAALQSIVSRMAVDCLDQDIDVDGSNTMTSKIKTREICDINLLRFVKRMRISAMMLQRNNTNELVVWTAFDMLYYYEVRLIGLEQHLKEVTFVDLREKLKSRIDYPFLFLDSQRERSKEKKTSYAKTIRIAHKYMIS